MKTTILLRLVVLLCVLTAIGLTYRHLRMSRVLEQNRAMLVYDLGGPLDDSEVEVARANGQSMTLDERNKWYADRKASLAVTRARIRDENQRLERLLPKYDRHTIAVLLLAIIGLIMDSLLIGRPRGGIGNPNTAPPNRCDGQ